jgi:phenylacetate-coenzyme A ligase PaaK-like adenylate-forming protein
MTGRDKAWTGTIHYFTGGTVSSPKQISYNAQRWQRSIAIKQRLLSAYGVNEEARVVVCYPFAPWAIGPIFAEAALHCGASVLPIGNHCNQPDLLKTILAFNPTHLCSTARNLIYLEQNVRKMNLSTQPLGPVTAFVAGEALKPRVREKAATLWRANIVNVYGMAEFDMVASEFPDAKGHLALVPEFDYAVRTEEGIQLPLSAGLEGELLIRETVAAPWYPTGDCIRVVDLDHSPWGSQKLSARIEVLHRLNETVSLADGTKIIGEQIDRMLLDHPDLEHIQVAVNKTDSGESIQVYCVPKSETRRPEPRQIRLSLLNANVDLTDSARSGFVSSINVRFVREDQLRRSTRGKIPRLLEVCQYESV